MATEQGVDDRLVDAFALASRALVAVAARSLGGLSGVEITLPQYRTLVILATRGPQRIVDLAGGLDVNASTASRMVDRLVRKKLVRRQRDEADRRAMTVGLTDKGSGLVSEATTHRRAEIQRILLDVPLAHRELLVEAMVAFAAAAGEPSGGDLFGGEDDYTRSNAGLLRDDLRLVDGVACSVEECCHRADDRVSGGRVRSVRVRVGGCGLFWRSDSGRQALGAARRW